MLVSTTNAHFSAHYDSFEATKILVEAGFTALDCSMMDMKLFPFTDDYKETAKAMRAYAEEHGVRFNQSHAPFGSYEQHINEILPNIERAFEASALLGIGAMVIHPTQRTGYYGREEAIYKENVEIYRSLAPLAKKYGVKIAIENMWSRDPMLGRVCDAICADPRELARMYDELADPEAFTICLDLGHVALCGRRPEDAIRIIGGQRLGALHVHDVVDNKDLHVISGLGIIKWDEVCRALAEIDYSGELTLEADDTYNYFEEAMWRPTARFMAERAKSLANKIEEYKAEKI